MSAPLLHPNLRAICQLGAIKGSTMAERICLKRISENVCVCLCTSVSNCAMDHKWIALGHCRLFAVRAVSSVRNFGSIPSLSLVSTPFFGLIVCTCQFIGALTIYEALARAGGARTKAWIRFA